MQCQSPYVLSNRKLWRLTPKIISRLKLNQMNRISSITVSANILIVAVDYGVRHQILKSLQFSSVHFQLSTYFCLSVSGATLHIRGAGSRHRPAQSLVHPHRVLQRAGLERQRASV